MNDLETAHRRALRRAVDMPCEVISNYVDEPLLYWATDLSPYGLWLDTPFPMAGREQVVVRKRSHRAIMLRKALTYLSPEQRAYATGGST